MYKSAKHLQFQKVDDINKTVHNKLMGFGYLAGKDEWHQGSYEGLAKKLKIDELIKKPETKQADEITFVEGYTNGCIGLIDIVNSTRITAKLDHTKVGKYYSIFLNTMASLVRDFGGIVAKNIGDSILYYFPETFDTQNDGAFKKVLECNLAMINFHPALNQKMHSEGLPNVDYRISSDFGPLMMAESLNSTIADIFSQTVNICTKINKIARPNSVVVGGDLHQIIKKFGEYEFDLVAAYSSGLKLDYPVYALLQRKSKRSLSQ